MAGNRQARDERRRLELMRNRKKPGRPLGLTSVRHHSKRFETVIWITFRKLGFQYRDAGGLTFLLFQGEGISDLLDVGQGYALWHARNPFSRYDDEGLPRHYHELQKTSDRLIERCRADVDDRLWLDSAIAAFGTVWEASRVGDGAAAETGLSLLRKLGWPDKLMAGMANRLAKLPAHSKRASTFDIESFWRSARKHRIKGIPNSDDVSSR